MSKFVNYSKRGVTLPAGCKNLADMMNPRPPLCPPVPRFTPLAGEPRTIHRASGTLSVVLQRVEQLFASRTARVTLAVGTLGQQASFGLCGVASDQVLATVWVSDDLEHARRIQDLRTRCVIQPFKECLCIGEDGKMPRRYLIFSLSSALPPFLEITRELLSNVHRFADEPSIGFAHW